MPIGENLGGNLNILIFEVGMVTTREVLGVETTLVNTVSIHPLLVAPRSIRYNDPTRSSVQQTGTSSQVTVAGRGLREVVLEGCFGVEERGMLGYLGTGEMRFQRFYREVVRMGEAMSQAQVDENIDILNGTPGIRALVAPYSKDGSIFYVNFYDFWNDRSFQCVISSFSSWREAGKGGATGLVWYQMVLKEAGGLVQGGLGESIISALMQGLTTWAALNDVLTAYTVTNLIDSFGSALAIPAQQLADTLEGIGAQIDSVTGLMGGQYGSNLTSLSQNDGAASLLETVARVTQQAQDLSDRVSTLVGGGMVEETGAADWTTDDGGSLEFRAHDERLKLEALAEAAEYQQMAGVFFGMSREDYIDFVTSGGALGQLAPDLSGSIDHVVSATDTPDAIEDRYNVNWSAILDVNGLLPDEALLEGVVLHIPRPRPRGPTGIDGLPTFGSHVGESALGVDVGLELLAGEDGDLGLVSGEDCMVQGATYLVEWAGDSLLHDMNQIPEAVRDDYLLQHLRELFLGDRRVLAVSDMEVEIDATGAGYNASVTLQTVNGDAIRLGGV